MKDPGDPLLHQVCGEAGQAPHLPLCVMVPDPRPKRALTARQLARRERVTLPLDEEALRDRLRAIRVDTAEHLDELLGRLTSALRRRAGVVPLEATTAQEAAVEISRLAGSSGRVLVNRSATVAELLPYLRALGLEVVQTYDEQFIHPAHGVERYWQLDLTSPKAAWQAFHPRSIEASSRSLIGVGVLGVNVIAAEDGAVSFVQHLFNISEILARASNIVLVAGLEHLARDRNAAALVARAQARYGALSVALGVPRRGGNSRGEVPAGRDLAPGPPACGLPEVTAPRVPARVILLDNGRRSWLGDARTKDLFLCIGCRACSLECPTQPYYGGEMGLTPRDYLTAFLRGDTPSLGECLTCGRCRDRCPLDIDLPTMISEAEAKAGAATWQDQFYCRIGELFQVASLTAPLSNRVFEWPLARLPIEWVSGMDRERQLPRFHRDNFVRQTRRRTPRPAEDRTVVYYPGCYANFTDPALGWAVVGILERNRFQVIVPDHVCCGVASFSYGAKHLARRYARQALKVLAPLARQGHTILVSCPSCGMALERDFPHLLPQNEDARLVAQGTRDASDFLWAMHQRGELETDFAPITVHGGYHTPCHLRVRGLGPENPLLLALIPGLEATQIDRGCCGMGGSFGMRRAHRDESREIGRFLFQELQSPAYDLGITNCAGCEMQMRAGSGRDVVHPLKLLWQAYSGDPTR